MEICPNNKSSKSQLLKHCFLQPVNGMKAKDRVLFWIKEMLAI
jgi:hypothetical protein